MSSRLHSLSRERLDPANGEIEGHPFRGYHCRVVNGDTCKIATSIAVDSGSIACAPVKIGDQGTLGASAVILPGTTVGAQATLAPLAAPAVGSVIEPKTINIGAPAVAVKVHAGSLETFAPV